MIEESMTNLSGDSTESMARKPISAGQSDRRECEATEVVLWGIVDQ